MENENLQNIFSEDRARQLGWQGQGDWRQFLETKGIPDPSHAGGKPPHGQNQGGQKQDNRS